MHHGNHFEQDKDTIIISTGAEGWWILLVYQCTETD